MILIQRLETHWTKASRGAPGAELRAKVGYVYALPSRCPEGVAFYQHVRFYEEHRFAPRVAREETLSSVPLGDLGVEFETQHERLKVFYLWSAACGAPERIAGKRALVLDIPLDGWAQFIHNGRFANEDGWVYQQIVYNLASSSTFSPDIFDRRLSATEQRIAQLW